MFPFGTEQYPAWVLVLRSSSASTVFPNDAMQNMTTQDNPSVFQLLENLYELQTHDSVQSLLESSLQPFLEVLSQEFASTLQPHLDRATQNIDRYNQLQTQLTHLQQITRHLNIIFLTPKGEIQQATPQAEKLLQNYFEDFSPTQLPLPIQQWLQLQLKQQNSTPFQAQHLTPQQNNRLTIQLIRSQKRLYLTLQEHSTPKITQDSFKNAGLTPRQSEILFHVAQGSTNESIAQTLSIHPTTVKTHLTNIRHKFNATSRLSAVTIALKQIGINS
jgi:DNA-binding CsgD family transcriptional regulator